MLWNVWRRPLFFLSGLIFFTALILFTVQAADCQAREVSVELVWHFGQAGWTQIQVEQGEYQLVMNGRTVELPEGSSLQAGWGGWSPVLIINRNDVQTLGSGALELNEVKPGSLRLTVAQEKPAVYRGSLSLNWQEDHWQLINRLDSEDYLKGVVPMEMSNAWAQNGLEALKAQAVAARTYLIQHTQNRKLITDSPDIDQAYAGKTAEGEASQAVEATRGKILADSQTRQPIAAFYSSHDGGYSEDAANVWGNHDPHNLAHPDPFSDGIGGAADRWRFIIAAPRLGAAFGLGPVQKVSLDTYPSGRVRNVVLTDSFNNSRTVSGRKFVQAFYPFGQEIQADAFLGSLFQVEQAAANPLPAAGQGSAGRRPGALGILDQGRIPAEPDAGPLLAKVVSSSQGVQANPQPFGTFIFNGRGWGHGVGMSQWGAYHMAQLGYTYQEILNFYYSHAVLETAD